MYDRPRAIPHGTSGFSSLSALTVDPLASGGARKDTVSVDVVRHFQRNWDEIFHMPGIYRIISLSENKPLVYNAILTLSACHLRHTSSGITRHRIAEHLYQSLALEQYQKVFNMPREALGHSGIEALLFSAMLLNILTFPLVESGANHDQSASWVFGPCDDLKGWLALQGGIKPLVMSASTQVYEIRRSIGETMFGCDENNWPTPNFDLDLSTLPYAWIKAFNLENSESVDDFGQPIAILRQLQYIEPLRSHVFRNLLFVWKMPLRFRTLLYSKDERALWLFGYWLGLLCRYKEAWWCEKRVQRDHQAICVFLNQLCLPDRAGSEGKIWRQMMNEIELAPVYSYSEVLTSKAISSLCCDMNSLQFLGNPTIITTC